MFSPGDAFDLRPPCLKVDSQGSQTLASRLPRVRLEPRCPCTSSSSSLGPSRCSRSLPRLQLTTQVRTSGLCCQQSEAIRRAGHRLQVITPLPGVEKEGRGNLYMHQHDQHPALPTSLCSGGGGIQRICPTEVFSRWSSVPSGRCSGAYAAGKKSSQTRLSIPEALGPRRTSSCGSQASV